MNNPIATASAAKGRSALWGRARSIAERYGLTTGQMDQALDRFAGVLAQFDCGATFPITAVTLQRHHATIAKYLGRKIEFAVHGYTHVDYARLTVEQQRAHLERARRVFLQAGITPVGFRSPYLSRPAPLNAALQAAGFCYVSNQPLLWDVLDAAALEGPGCAGYERALAYYQPWQAQERLSLPRLVSTRHPNPLVEIPVSLPDDEILVERLGAVNGQAAGVWRRILAQTYQRGELFTLQLHPERIELCADSLAAVLAEARAHTPAVWCACLSEVAAWWQVRARAAAQITPAGDGCYRIQISAPAEAAILARAVHTDAPAAGWVDGYQQIYARTFNVRASRRPVIGLSPASAPALAGFLRQQGYLVETITDGQDCAYELDQPEFSSADERRLLAHIEAADFPLVRLGRWPNGARSALCISGDVDALTLWDYGLRLIGR